MKNRIKNNVIHYSVLGIVYFCAAAVLILYGAMYFHIPLPGVSHTTMMHME